MKQHVIKLSGKSDQLEAKVTRHESQIITLTNEFTDLKERVSAQEKYTTKDCIIFYNIPIDATSDDLDIDMCRVVVLLLNDFLQLHSKSKKHEKKKI